jgi:hypothetical protein
LKKRRFLGSDDWDVAIRMGGLMRRVIRLMEGYMQISLMSGEPVKWMND